MPDITMCKGEDCPQKMTCYRHLAQPSKLLQSYFVNKPWDGAKCDRYWPLSKSEAKRRIAQKDVEQKIEEAKA